MSERPVSIIVESDADKAVVEALAAAFGVELEPDVREVVSARGAGNLGKVLTAQVAAGHRVCGLYDVAHERYIADALNRQVGDDLARQGFFACTDDVNDELIRALGVAAVTEILESNADAKGFRNFQDQPAYAALEPDQQLRAYFGSNGARGATYGAAMVQAIGFEALPEPLMGLLNWLWSLG